MIVDLLKNTILPSNLVFLFLVLGVTASIWRGIRKAALCFFSIGAGCYFIFGSGPVSYWLLSNLEYYYQPFTSIEEGRPVEGIVVLAGYAVSDPSFPISSRVNDATLFRLSEAMVISRQMPSAKVILSGPNDMTSVMKELVVAIGVSPAAVVQAQGSSKTSENIKTLQSILKEKCFILITSAGHMPRAMMLSRQLGYEPIPAPTDFYTTKDIFRSNWLPSPFHLKCSDFAVHEYAAMMYYLLKPVQ